ncbi:MAG: hypothetical protein ACYC3B_08390 [Sedimentisphaerales bacterium]
MNSCGIGFRLCYASPRQVADGFLKIDDHFVDITEMIEIDKGNNGLYIPYI